jgi:outer membrane protein TolC
VVAATELTVSEVHKRTLEYNRQYLSTLQEIKKAEGDVSQARSGALPNLTLSSGYTHNFNIPSSFIRVEGETQELQFGFANDWQVALSLRQAIFEGGKVWTAYAIAKQYKKYTKALADQVAAGVLYQGEVLFYQAILSQARLAVLLDAMNTYTHNVEVVEQLHSKGLVSRFELLRARTEQANLRPQILEAESEVELAEKRLKSFLGLPLDEEIELNTATEDTSLVRLPELQWFIDTALAGRPAMQQAELMLDLRGKAITVAKAGYFPNLSAVSQFSWQASSDEFRLTENNTESFTAGLQLSWNIFDGGRTSGEVGKAKAERRQAELNRLDLIDQVKLEVEQAYDQLVQAKQSLDVQGQTIAQAEEGLRIANLRYEAGEGTLLEVLSAQTALTEARTAREAALFSFRNARASLRQATTVDINELLSE